MSQEGAAHFFLRPQTENFVISCWDRLNTIQKTKTKTEKKKTKNKNKQTNKTKLSQK